MSASTRNPRSSTRSRLWASVLLTLYVVALGTLTAHTQLEATLRGDRAHVEAEGTQACYQTLDHRFCQLCRLIGDPAALNSGAELAFEPAQPRDFAAPSSHLQAASVRLSGLGPRAPPLS